MSHKVIPLCNIEADWPVKMRPMAGGLNQSLAKMRTVFSGGHALYFLCEHTVHRVPDRFKCELHDPDRDDRIPDWPRTWLVQ